MFGEIICEKRREVNVLRLCLVFLFFVFFKISQTQKKKKPQGELPFVSVSGPLSIISPQGKRVFIP